MEYSYNLDKKNGTEKRILFPAPFLMIFKLS